MKNMSESSRHLSRRAALVTLCAVGLQLAMSGRARAEGTGAAPTPTEWNSLSAEEQKILGPKYGGKWDGLAPEQQQRLLRGTRRWMSMSPEQRDRAKVRFERWQQLTPEQKDLARQRWHRYRELTPEQQERVRQGYRNFKKLSPEQRKRLRERWQNATPEERQRWLERRRQHREGAGRPRP
jgi:hypothetical protein